MGRNLRRRSATVLVALVALIGGLVATAPSAVAAPGTVSGSVSRTSGAPLGGGGQVVFCPQSLQPGQWSFCSFLGGVGAPLAIDGTYTTALSAGDWYVVAIVGGRKSAPVGPFTVNDDDVLTQDFSLVFGQVHGTVTNPVGGAIGNATVKFCAGVASTCAVPIQTPVQTDGTYVIALDEGTWTGTATAQAGTSMTAAPVTLVDGDDLVVDFQIGGGRIEGSLLDAAGVPAGSTVLQICSGGVCKPGLYVTGPTWAVDGVPAGTYTVTGAAIGGGLWLPLDPTPVVVSDGATTNGVVLQLGGGSIVATVTDGTNPIAGASLQPCLQGYPHVPNGELCTGTASNVGALDHERSSRRHVLGQGVGHRLRIDDGERHGQWGTTEADVVLSQGGTVTGQVTGTLDAATAVVACPGVDPDPDFTVFRACRAPGRERSLSSGNPPTYTINGVAGVLHLRAYTGSGTANDVVTGVSPVSIVSVPAAPLVSQNLFLHPGIGFGHRRAHRRWEHVQGSFRLPAPRPDDGHVQEASTPRVGSAFDLGYVTPGSGTSRPFSSTASSVFVATR